MTWWAGARSAIYGRLQAAPGDEIGTHRSYANLLPPLGLGRSPSNTSGKLQPAPAGCQLHRSVVQRILSRDVIVLGQITSARSERPLSPIWGGRGRRRTGHSQHQPAAAEGPKWTGEVASGPRSGSLAVA